MTFFEAIRNNDNNTNVLFCNAIPFVEAGIKVKAIDLFIYAIMCQDYILGNAVDYDRLCTYTKRSKQTVKRHIKKLKEQGLIRDSGEMVDVTTLSKREKE